MFKMGNVGTLTMEVIRRQARKAGYEELPPLDGMTAAFLKNRNLVCIYKDGSIKGGAL